MTKYFITILLMYILITVTDINARFCLKKMFTYFPKNLLKDNLTTSWFDGKNHAAETNLFRVRLPV